MAETYWFYIYLRNYLYPLKKWEEYFHGHYIKEDLQMTIKRMKRCSTSLVTQKIRIVKVERLTISSISKGTKGLEISSILVRKTKLYYPLAK